MRPSAFVTVVFASIPVVLSAATPASQAAVPFFTPTAGGGSWFDDAGGGLGEPLNVREIIFCIYRGCL